MKDDNNTITEFIHTQHTCKWLLIGCLLGEHVVGACVVTVHDGAGLTGSACSAIQETTDTPTQPITEKILWEQLLT